MSAQSVEGQALSLFWSLSGGFTPCLRSSSEPEHTVVLLIQSSEDDYLMNETRRKPTTRTQCPTLFCGTGSFTCPVVQTQLDIQRPLFTQSWITGMKVKVLRHKAYIFEPPNCQSTVEHANHQTTMTAPSRRINFTPGSQRGDLLPIKGIVCNNSPAMCRPSPGGPGLKYKLELGWIISTKKDLQLNKGRKLKISSLKTCR